MVKWPGYLLASLIELFVDEAPDLLRYQRPARLLELLADVDHLHAGLHPPLNVLPRLPEEVSVRVGMVHQEPVGSSCTMFTT